MNTKGSRRQIRGGERPAVSHGRTPAPAMPLTPRPRLFWILLAAFVLWLGVLAGLYYGT